MIIHRIDNFSPLAWNGGLKCQASLSSSDTVSETSLKIDIGGSNGFLNTPVWTTITIDNKATTISVFK